MTDHEYDEATCITAGELREAGMMHVLPHIPDCAWVPRSAVRVERTKVTMADDGTLTSTTCFEVTEPFRWVDVKVKIEGLPQ